MSTTAALLTGLVEMMDRNGSGSLPFEVSPPPLPHAINPRKNTRINKEEYLLHERLINMSQLYITLFTRLLVKQ
jgi:hypothetical protein